MAWIRGYDKRIHRGPTGGRRRRASQQADSTRPGQKQGHNEARGGLAQQSERKKASARQTVRTELPAQAPKAAGGQGRRFWRSLTQNKKTQVGRWPHHKMKFDRNPLTGSLQAEWLSCQMFEAKPEMWCGSVFLFLAAVSGKIIFMILVEISAVIVSLQN